MASSAALLLRRTLSLSRGMLRRTFPATSSTSSHLSPILLPPISQSPPDGNTVTGLLPSRGFRSTSFSLSASRSYNNNFDDKIDEDTILFEGCDYKHWLITMDFPKDPKPSPEEMVETYVQTLAKVVGSVEEAKKRMYACSTTTYTGFQAEMDEETSKKFEGLPGVVFILPDSYIDPVNKEYGGDKYINGTIIPRPPPVHYGRPRRNRDQPQRGEMRNQQYGSSYGQQGSMQGDFRNFSPQQSPPQLNYGPPQNMTSQHRSGPPQSIPPQQNHSGAPQSIPPQQNYSGPPQNFPPQQNYSGPPQNFSPQQNYGGPPQNFPPQQNYCGPPQNFPPQQNYGGPPNFHPRPSYGQPPNYPSQQGYGPPIQEQRPNAMPLPNRDNRDVGRDAFQGAPYRGGGFNQGSNFSQEPREHTLGNQTGYTQSPRGFPENNQSYAPPSGSFDQGGGTYGRGPAVAGRYGQTPNSGYGTDNAFQGENKHPGSSSAKEENDDEQRNQRGQMGTGQGRY